MDELLALLVFLVVGVAIGVVLWLKWRSEQQRVKALSELARSLDGARLLAAGDADQVQVAMERGGHEVRLGFTTEVTRHHHPGQRSSTSYRYYTDLLLVLGPSRIDVEISHEDLLGKLAKKLVNPDLELGDPEFDRRFLVYADDARAVRGFLTPQVREAIGGLACLAPGDDLQITLVQKGLRIRLRGRACEQERMALLAELGLQVVDGYLDALEAEAARAARRSEPPKDCAACGERLSGRPVTCRWCGARMHPECAADDCPACGALLKERGAR